MAHHAGAAPGSITVVTLIEQSSSQVNFIIIMGALANPHSPL